MPLRIEKRLVLVSCIFILFYTWKKSKAPFIKENKRIFLTCKPTLFFSLSYPLSGTTVNVCFFIQLHGTVHILHKS